MSRRRGGGGVQTRVFSAIRLANSLAIWWSGEVELLGAWLGVGALALVGFSQCPPMLEHQPLLARLVLLVLLRFLTRVTKTNC